MFLSDWQKIGLALTTFGLIFLGLGVLMVFDRGLLAMGNLLFLTGTSFLLGRARTLSFFFQRARWRGTLAFFLGLFILLSGWTVIGMLIESFGALNLFGNFFPEIRTVLCALPFVGDYFTAFFESAIVLAIGARITWLTGRVAMPLKGP